jgi:predicted DCC family thiol-disulfide oxidoreductase YuxK
MLYDGDCPLCMREVHFLRGRDAGKGAIDFVDIAAPAYDPAANQGVTFDEAMGRIHAIMADGSVVTDVEVFRRLYEVRGPLVWALARCRAWWWGAGCWRRCGCWRGAP